MTINAIRYQAPDLAAAEAFYRDVLGCSVSLRKGFLTCAFPRGAVMTFERADVAPHEPDKASRYWKIGLTLPDLDRAVAHLDHIGWPVSRPRQFLDIGYMCHLSDPAGLPIELLQHGFEGRSMDGPAGHDIGAQATLAHLTLRAETREEADREWREEPGMTLLSIQPVPSHGFTLYFYGATNETPPDDDLTSVRNREWLWRRPCTLVEVQVFDDGRAIRPVDPAQAGLTGFEVGSSD